MTALVSFAFTPFRFVRLNSNYLPHSRFPGSQGSQPAGASVTGRLAAGSAAGFAQSRTA